MALFANKDTGKITDQDGNDWSNTDVHSEINAGYGTKYGSTPTDDPNVVQLTDLDAPQVKK